MSNKHVKRWSVTIKVREMQIKTMYTQQKLVHLSTLSVDEDLRRCWYTIGRRINGHPFGEQMISIQWNWSCPNVITQQSHFWAWTLWNLLHRNEHRHFYMSVHCDIIHKKRHKRKKNWSTCSRIGKWVNKWWHIFQME